MSPSWEDSEEGTSTGRRDSRKKGGKDGFPGSVPHERLTYGVKGAAVTGVTGAPYIEGGCGLYGGSSSWFWNCDRPSCFC